MANVLTPAGGIFRRLVEPGQEVEYGQKLDVILDPSKKSILHFLKFLPTPSARRATLHEVAVLIQQRISIHALREEGDRAFLPRCRNGAIFLSTPSARRATVLISFILPNVLISIHALREEGDTARLTLRMPETNFYPRPP